jgi:hypothetical protein
MYKIICNQNECANKDIVYYMPEATNPTMCGGCKSDLKPELMSQEEYDAVFDYDPFAKIETIGGSE